MTGSAISLLNILRFLDKSIYQPIVVLGGPGPLEYILKSEEISVEIIPMVSFPTSPGYHYYEFQYWKSFLFLIPNLRLIRYLQKSRPDIIHINDKQLLSAGLASFILHIPILWHIRSSYNITFSKFAVTISKSIIRFLSEHLIIISEDESDGFENFHKASIINNSVDVSSSGDLNEQKKQILLDLGLDNFFLVGHVSTSINQIRGTYDFIETASKVVKKLPNAKIKFLIVSRIPQINDLNQNQSKAFTEYQIALEMIKDLNLQEKIVISDFRENILPILSLMDILVVCNHHGVLGRLPLEAMTIGCPLIVAAGHSRKSSVAKNFHNALIVDQVNSNEISEAITILYSFPALAKRISENGKKHAENFFNPKINIRKIEEIYSKCIFQPKNKVDKEMGK